jgi:hypothetical protein
MRGQKAARLVIEKQPRALAPRQRLAIDRDLVGIGHVKRRRVDHLAVDAHAPGLDPRLDRAARGEPGARNHLGDARSARGMIALLADRHLHLEARRSSRGVIAELRSRVAQARECDVRGV